MAIDYEKEELLTIGQAAKRLPGRPAIRTVWRWVQVGCWRVKLESVLIGGRRYTSAEALRRFIEATTHDIETRRPELSARRKRAIAKAEAELEQAGI